MRRRTGVIVVGALGKMGRETIKAIVEDEDLELRAAVDIKAKGEKLAELTSIAELDTYLANDLAEVLESHRADVMVDFTSPQAVFNNAKSALKKGISCVIGTTGLNEIEIRELARIAGEMDIGIAIIPNFAIGAILMMKFASEAAKYFPEVEIIELHHDQKMDAPSGTAIKTAEMINESSPLRPPRNRREFEKIAGCRGGELGQVRIHSVRLPGLIAHQEVIFGGIGQGLKIRHDSFDRAGFMPGVIMVIKKILHSKGLIYGMENLL